MKVASIALVSLLLAAALILPEAATPTPDPAPTTAPASFSVCPLPESAQRSSTIEFLGTEGASVEATLFSATQVLSQTPVQLEGGSASLAVDDVTGIARAPFLMGLSEPSIAAETLLVGNGLAVAACGPGSANTVTLAGGSTVEGETSTLLLANPFSGQATVDVAIASEVGAESEEALSGVVVPPRSLVSLDLGAILSGRQVMSASVTTMSGRVVAAWTQEGGGDVGAMGAVLPSPDWYFPLPAVDGASANLILVAAGTAEVPFQIDVYGPEGPIEAQVDDVVPARGQVVVPLAELAADGATAIRVVAAGPVGAALRLAGEGMRALLPGVAQPGPGWALAGVGGEFPAEVLVLNPLEIPALVGVTDGAGDALDEFEVPPGETVSYQAQPGTGGIRLQADNEVVVVWIAQGDFGLAADAGEALAN